MRRKTKPRVVWLPNTNANSIGAAGRSTWQTFIVNAATGAVGDAAVGEIPIVIDSQDDPLDPVTSLSDMENSGYRLRRVVGKIFAFADQDIDRNNIFGVTAGLIIRRSDPTTGLSFALTTGDPTLLDPADITNQSDPWIWKRNWILFNNNAGAAGTLGLGPSSSTEYGSVADGSHVDAKTARIVSSEERLFLNVSIINLATAAAAPGVVQIFTDLRVLASMRTSSGNRRNASR